MDKWISIADKLPKPHNDVLIYSTKNKGMILKAYLGREKDAWYVDDGFTHTYIVTHWMPLPEPPKGGQQ